MRKQVFAWFSIVIIGACGFPLLEENGIIDRVVTGAPCAVDANCDDKNPCTTEICPPMTHVCESIKQMDGDAPNSEQTPEDCRTVVCKAGAPSTVEDSQDVINDHNSCTTDACVGGVPTNEVVVDGAECTQGTKSGLCNVGLCEIACANDNDCDDGNSCSNEFCNMSLKCVYVNIDGLPTPGVAPVVGDCRLHLCVGGVDTEINDEADVNNDGNPCTTDICSAGMPSNPLVPERTLCMPGDVKVCTSIGVCAECVVAADCVNIAETECEKRSCVNNTCQIAYEGQTTLASPVLQTAKDCKKVVCNGNMGTTKVNDDADLPDDGKVCTKDVCTNGVPSNPFESVNTPCGNGPVCNATGVCQGCTSASQCAGVDDFCKTRTCLSNVCGFSYTANGTDLPTGQTTGDCKILECDGAGNVKTSVLQSDVPVDGNACTQDVCSAAGTPSNPPTPINSACNVNGNDACDGSGNCKKSLGKTCSGAGAECVSTNCVDGVCCNTTCTTTCQACNVPVSVGTCSDVPKGLDDGTCMGATVSCSVNHSCGRENGQPCNGASTCLSNFCVDGVCCDSACNVDCKSCNVSGSLGTCSNVPVNQDDGACSGATLTCDGMGTCKMQ